MCRTWRLWIQSPGAPALPCPCVLRAFLTVRPAAPGDRAAVRTVFRFLEDGTKVRLLTVHHDGAAGSTPTCISKATAPGVSRAHELLQSHAEGRATQLATNGRVAGSARPPRKGSHHRPHQSCSAPLTLAPGDPQVRVTRGKLASGSIVERPAVLTQRKWDRPSAGTCVQLCTCIRYQC